MNKNPLVSIMIPNYNHSRYLGTCIESALNQTYDNIEIVVLDNMSQDDSMQVAARYIKRGVRVCRNVFNILNQSYLTMADPSLTSGKYMMLLCADDYIHPEFVSKAVDIMERHPNIGYVHGERDFVNEEGEVYSLDPFFQCSFWVPGERIMPLYMVTTIAHPSQGIYRRESFLIIGGYDLEIDHMNADRALWYYLSYISDYAYIREKMSFIRIGNQTETFVTQTNLQHPILCHLTIKDFVKFAKKYNLENVLEREKEANERLSNEFINYAAGMILAKEEQKAEVYMDYAVVLNRNIVHSKNYKVISQTLSGAKKDEEIIRSICRVSMIKKRGYKPPEGYFELCKSTL